MDPVILLVAGAVTSGVAGVQQARVTRAQGKVQQQVAEYNAKQVQRQGEARMDAAKIQSERISRQEKMVEAANIARAGKSGISLAESKSTVEVLADAAYQFHLDRNFTLQQGMADYLQANQQASLLRAEGAFQKRVMRQQGTLQIIGAIGGGAATAGMAGMKSTVPGSTSASTPQYSLSQYGQAFQSGPVLPTPMSATQFFGR